MQGGMKDDARSTFNSMSFKERPTLRALNTVQDDLAEKYCALADDASQGTKRREAAMLLSAADEQYSDELPEEAKKSAEEALEIFREIGDRVSAADAVLIIIRANNMMAVNQNMYPEEAIRIATLERDIAKDGQDKRSEACVLLATAEIRCSMKGRTHLVTALDAATDALALCKEEKDKPMEAYAHITLANIYFLKNKYKDVLDSANAALKIFKDVGDDKGKAKALHAVALSYVMKGDHENMIKYAEEALELYRLLGLKRAEIYELAVLAQFHLLQNKPNKALRPAHEALTAIREMETPSRSTEAFMQYIVCDSLVLIGRHQPALKEAKKGLQLMQDSGDQRGIIMGWQLVLYCMFQQGDLEEAANTVEEALKIIDEVGDKRMELNMKFLSASIHRKMGENEKAVREMKDALELTQELEDAEEEAAVQRMISDIYIAQDSSREALQAAKEAQNLAEDVGDKIGEALALVLTAFAYDIDGEREKAISAASEAQDFFEEEDDVAGASVAHRLITELQLADEKYDEALQAAQRRQELWEEVGNEKEIAFAMHGVAMVHIANDNPEDAQRVCLEAQTLNKKVENKQLEVALLLVQASIQVMFMNKIDVPDNKATPPSKDFTEALIKGLKYATEAMGIATKYCTKKEDGLLRARSVFWRVQLLHYGGNEAEVIRTGAYAQKLFEECGCESGAAEALILQAYAHFNLRDKDKALEVANTALDVARGCGSFATENAALAAIEKIEYVEPVFVPAQQMFQADPSAMAVQDTGAAAAVSVAKPEPKGLDPAMTKQKLMRMVKDVIASDDDLETDSPFMEAGMDSLSSVQLMTEVSKEFQLSLSPSLIFDFPTVRAMVDHLVEESKSAMELAY
mmetsp:Transcript_15266/g.43648  ORF Transcript_15266/g.43648 Transcript_15266/m.43648 type:complete len:863 (-) Transcript_15266:232-2820(-)